MLQLLPRLLLWAPGGRSCTRGFSTAPVTLTSTVPSWFSREFLHKADFALWISYPFFFLTVGTVMHWWPFRNKRHPKLIVKILHINCKWAYFILIDFIFWSHSRFTAKLSGKYKAFLETLLPHTCTASPTTKAHLTVHLVQWWACRDAGSSPEVCHWREGAPLVVCVLWIGLNAQGRVPTIIVSYWLVSLP